MMPAELGLARETAEAFRQVADNEGLTTEAAVARRCLAYARLWQAILPGRKPISWRP